jgi:hypothetical protein
VTGPLLANAEWVTLLDGRRVVRYVDSGLWIVVEKDGIYSPVAQNIAEVESRVRALETELMEAHLELARLRVKPLVDAAREADNAAPKHTELRMR